MSSSTAGATGKDTSTFFSDISRINKPQPTDLPVPTSNPTMDDHSTYTTSSAAVQTHNDSCDERVINGEERSSEDDVISEHQQEDENYGEEIFVEDNDEFATLQNMSTNDFKAALNFSINRAAKAGFTATLGSSSKQTPIPSKSSTTFDRYTTVFKVSDEISGEEIPHQEIPNCIWKLVQAKVPLALSCITTTALRFIHSNPTSIKTTKSADGVSQSKELMLDMSAFGVPEDISQSDWQDAWINQLEIIKNTSDEDIYKYFKAHKRFISQQEDFTDEFEAYKRFDIWFCRHYTNTHFRLSQQQYQSKVLKFKLKFPQSSFILIVPQSSLHAPSQPSRVSPKFDTSENG